MVKLNIWDLDGWSLSHVAYNMLLGYMFPDLFMEAMALGVIWELWENWYGHNAGKKLIGIANCNLGTDPASANHERWWYGKYSDIAMNLTGFLIGQYMKTGRIYTNQPSLLKVSA